MKKLLGIVVLGLLLSGNAYAKIIKLHCEFIVLLINEETFRDRGSGFIVEWKCLL